MKIKIGYSSKWSNSFSDEITKENIALSMSAIQDSIKGMKVSIKEEDSYEDIMFKIKEVHPNFKYNPITKNTVLGVLARLLGEIRYLSNFIEKEKDHIINKLKDKITFSLHERNIFNEVVRISTPQKEVQNNGGGLIKKSAKDNILLTENKYSKLIYSAFALNNIEIINEFLDIIEKAGNIDDLNMFFNEKGLVYEQEFDLYKFIELYNKNIKETSYLDKDYRGFIQGKKEKTEEIDRYISTLKRIGEINHKDPDYHFQPKYINMAGIIVYICTKFIERNAGSETITGRLTEKKGNIKGIAEASGGLTIKDFYNAFSDKKTTSDTPYFLSAKYFDKKEARRLNQGDFNLGVTKEDGILVIDIAITEEEAIELKNVISCVGVSSFQLGKKGLAYIKEIDIYE